MLNISLFLNSPLLHIRWTVDTQAQKKPAFNIIAPILIEMKNSYNIGNLNFYVKESILNTFWFSTVTKQ